MNQGEVHTLLGENGAGKITLMNMLIEAMTVFENIILGTHKDHPVFIKKEKIQGEGGHSVGTFSDKVPADIQAKYMEIVATIEAGTFIQE